VFTAAEYASWVSAAGFGDVRTQRLPMPPHLVLVTGRK
jgi:hypothetical protein